MSDWEDMCDWLGIANDEFAADKVINLGDEEDDNFSSDAAISNTSHRRDLKPQPKEASDQPERVFQKAVVRYRRFNTYTEAAEWAKSNPGVSVGRTADGNGFEPKPSRNRGNSVEIWGADSDALKNLAPHLWTVLHKCASNSRGFTSVPLIRSRWHTELNQLSTPQTEQLRQLLTLDLERHQKFLRDVEVQKRRYRQKDGAFGEDLYEWLIDVIKGVIHDIDERITKTDQNHL